MPTRETTALLKRIDALVARAKKAEEPNRKFEAALRKLERRGRKPWASTTTSQT